MEGGTGERPAPPLAIAGWSAARICSACADIFPVTGLNLRHSRAVPLRLLPQFDLLRCAYSAYNDATMLIENFTVKSPNVKYTDDFIESTYSCVPRSHYLATHPLSSRAITCASGFRLPRRLFHCQERITRDGPARPPDGDGSTILLVSHKLRLRLTSVLRVGALATSLRPSTDTQRSRAQN